MADYFEISGVFRVESISNRLSGGGIYVDTPEDVGKMESFMHNKNLFQTLRWQQ